MNIRKTTLLFTLALALFVGGLSFANSNHASAAYNGARIIDNGVFLNANSMNVSQIQSFLASQGSGLASRSFVLQCYGAGSQERQLYTSVGAACDQNMSAAHIIYYASRIYGINPQVIMATLQKEQSLITTGNPTSWQLNQAMGYGCPTTGNCSGNSTFSYQIDSGTWVLRYHYERANGNNNWWSPSTSWVCGTEKNFYKPNLYPGQNVRFYDGNNVLYRTYFIENAATSSFYCYTPHAYNNPRGEFGRPAFGTVGQYYSGSYNFVTAFETWFGSTQTNTPFAWNVLSQLAYTDPGRTVPYSRSTISLQPGQAGYLRVQVRNSGNQSWSQSFVHLAPNRPQDRLSGFRDGSWLTNTRIRMNESTVLPGQTATFDFSITAPGNIGSYREYFSLVADGQTWMNDIGMYFSVDVVNKRLPDNTQPSTLNASQSISRNQTLISADQNSTLHITNYGSLALSNLFTKLWQPVSNGVDRLVMQPDGNLVAYSSSNASLWNSGTSGNPGARAVLQTDGNLVVYSASSVPLWNSSTPSNPDLLSVGRYSMGVGMFFKDQILESVKGNYRLVLQTDGNLVVYNNTNRPTWASGTANSNSSKLVMQTDGNLVLYDNEGQPKWHTNTSQKNGSFLAIQEDGNLVIYNPTDQAIWWVR